MHHNSNYLMNGVTASEAGVPHQPTATPVPVEQSATPTTTSSHVNRHRWSLPSMRSSRTTCPGATSTSIPRRHSTAMDGRPQSMFFEHQLCKEMDIGNLVVDRPRLRKRSFERRGAMDTSASSLDKLTHRAQSAPFILNHRSGTYMSNSSKQNATWDITPRPPPSNIGGESLKRSNECVHQQKEGPSSKLLKRVSMSRENLSKFINEIVRGKPDSEEKERVEIQEMKGNILLAQMASMQDKNLWNTVRGPSDD